MYNETDKIELKFQDIVDNADNVAEILNKEQLNIVSSKIYNDFEADFKSMSGWFDSYENSMDLALQVLENTNFPWEDAANIKYPLIVVAALAFNARAYPALMNGVSPVKSQLVGYDPQGLKTDIATAVEKHMNYQLLQEMTDWEDEMDKMLIVLPIVGSAYKKTYRNMEEGRNVSQLVLPKNLIVNYYTLSSNFDKTRKTEIFEETRNDLIKNSRRGLYREADFINNPKLTPSQADNMELFKREVEKKVLGRTEPTLDEDTPFTMLEYHGFLDLDGDGYSEPYIVTYNYDHKEVLRIVPRFNFESVEKNAKDEVVEIKPIEFYTPFTFIPNPEGFQGIGFGLLLGPLNEAVNASINQLLNSGVLSVLQSGFIGKSARITAKTIRLAPGEWKLIGTRGSALKDNLIPIPAKEPSNVMLALLEMLINAGQTVASTTEIMSGGEQPHNQKATTSQILKEESLRIFTAIYKRVRKALGKEFRKIFLLNALFEERQSIEEVLDNGLVNEVNIYDPTKIDVVPAADPTIALKEQKLALWQTVLELGERYGNTDMFVAQRKLLEAMETPDLDTVMPVNEQGQSALPPPPPPIELLQLDEQKRARVTDNRINIVDLMIKAKANKQGQSLNVGSQILELMNLTKKEEPKNESSKSSK